MSQDIEVKSRFDTDGKTIEKDSKLEEKELDELIDKILQTREETVKPIFWVVKGHFGVYSWRAVLILVVLTAIAFLKWKFMKGLFPQLTNFELQMFLLFVLIFSYICFVPGHQIRHSLPKGAKIQDLGDELSCSRCVTLKEEDLIHCRFCDCCTWNTKHHCTALGSCIDGYKFIPFVMLGVFGFFFIGAMYYQVAQLFDLIKRMTDGTMSAEQQTEIFQQFSNNYLLNTLPADL